MTIQEMREAMKARLEKARALQAEFIGEAWTDDINTNFLALMKEMNEFKAAIDRERELLGLEDPAGNGVTALAPGQIASQAIEVGFKAVYRNIGEQMMDVHAMTMDNTLAPAARERFQEVVNAANAFAKDDGIVNMTTGVDSEGGYLVETDKSKEIIETEVETGVLTSRCASQPIGPNSDSYEYYRADDRDRSAGVFLGGVKAYRKSETGTMDKYVKGLIEPQEVKLYDMYALLKVSNRMLRDHVAMTGMVKNSVPKSFAFKSDLEIWQGSGAGQHLGIMKSDILISIAKESSQDAKTINVNNLIKMFIRFKGNMKTAAWFVNQDTMGQFPLMTIGNQPIFVPGGSFANAPYGTLLGLPIVPIEFCSTLGTAGDIVLGDFSQYLRISKGSTEEAESIHVLFLSDQKLFRFIKRNNGQPIHDSAITPLNGTNTVSPFVTLAVRG